MDVIPQTLQVEQTNLDVNGHVGSVRLQVEETQGVGLVVAARRLVGIVHNLPTASSQPAGPSIQESGVA